MWKPAPAAPPFNWGLVKASYPRAYRALFEVAGACLRTAPGGDAPQRLVPDFTEEQLLAREYSALLSGWRPFQLSYLFAFFGSYGFVFTVRALRINNLGELPAEYRHGYTLRTPTALMGRQHPDGPYPFASHEIALHAAFLMAFHQLDEFLRDE